MRFVLRRAAGDIDPSTTHFEEDGVRYRRRSKSARNLDAALPERSKSREGSSVSERARSPHGSKRSSFEAGIQQHADSSRQSTEKMMRQASRDDFLPAELIQRSHLFNGP